MHIVKRHPVIVFYILAFVISWLGWVPQTLHARGLFPFDSSLFTLLGGAGPTLAAVIVLLMLKNKDGLRRLFASLLWGRASILWYLAAILLTPLITAAVIGLESVLGGPLPDWGKFVPISLIPLFIMSLLSNVWEEIGWRGFALPRLQNHFNALLTSFIMGLIWSLWHLPLMLNPNNPMSGFPWYAEIVFSLALTVIYTWMFNSTRGSLLFVTLFHAMSNTVAYALYGIEITTVAFLRHYLMTVGITAIVAVLIIVFTGARRLSRQAEAPIRIVDE